MADDLRKRVEKLLKQNSQESPTVSTDEAQQLVRDLQVHQVELERQFKERSAELHKREARFRGISTNMADWIWEIDTDGKYTFVSGKVKEVLGYEPDELIGKTPFDLMPEKEAESMGKYFSLLLDTKNPFTDLENWNLTKDGKPICLLSSAVPIFDDNGMLAGYRGVDTDITDRKEVEQTLRESEERFSTIFDQIPDGILLADPETRKFRMASHAFCTKIGYSEEQVLEMGSEGIHPAKDLPYVIDAFEKQARGEVEEVYDIPFLRSDGEIFYADMRAFRILLDGKPYLLGHVRDITGRKEAEKQIQFEQNLFHSLMETLPASVYFKDLDSRFTRSNNKHASNFGVEDKASLLGKSDFDFYPKEAAQKRYEDEQRVIKTRQPIQIEERHDGKWLLTTKAPLYDHNGEIIGTFGISFDITDNKITQQDLEKSQRLLRGVIDTMHGRVWWKDLNSVFMGCNMNFAHDAGLEHPGQVVGKTDYELCWKEQADGYVADDREVIESGKPKLGIQESLTQADGETLWVETNKTPLHDSTGKIIGTVGTYTDITERKRLKEALEKRIVALTRPLGHSTDISFEELFNLDEIQRMQDEFARATGVASIITLPDGSPITKPSHFTSLCYAVIRKTETGCANCYKSDAEIGRYHPDGPIIQKCLSGGLWDAGASIVVGDRHIANWLIGQVRDETQTEEQIRAYAREIGADEDAAAEEFHRVPVMSREHFKEIAQALFTLANQLSTSAYQNAQQARLIAEHEKAEAALSESEEKYRRIFESESDAIMIFDGESRRFVDVNSAAVKLYGYTREEFLQLTHHEITADAEISKTTIPATLAGEELPLFTSRHRKKDSTVFPVEISSCTFPLKGRPVVCGVIRDITQREEHEEERNKNREELRHLASELSLTEQRERQRIAAELHDSVSQLLSSSILRLDVLNREPGLPGSATRTLDGVCDTLKESIRQTQALTFELSCPLLNELGLAAALAELCISMSQEHAVRFEFKGSTDPLHLSLDGQLILYRSARELLINVVKHSGAHSSRIRLAQTGDSVQIFVEDDGRGFDSTTAGQGFSPSGGFGLFNMEATLDHAGGTLNIESIPGHGTRAILTLPLEKENE